MTPAQKLSAAVLKVLALHGWYAFKTGAGGFWKGKDFVRMGTPGTPDVIAVKGDGSHTRALLIELKANRDSLRPSQRDFAAKVAAAGAQYHVVRDVDDALKLVSNIQPNERPHHD